MPHWGNPFDLKVIEQKLKSWDNYEEVIMVYLETSTGMLNQIREIGELCKKYKKTFIVDAMSALACEELDMEKDNIDFCISSSNKGIGGPAVLSFVCCRKDKLGMYYDRSFYLNLNKYLEYGKINQTPTTPQIPLFYILNERLDALIEEGIDNIIKRYQENGFILQDELKLLKLNFYLKIYRSNVMVNVMIPDGYTFKEIHNKLKEKGFLIYNGKGILKDKVMNIATIGEITTKDIEEFIKALKEILNVE
jgi:2-aminoethylphosphonate-pyruvate transaminase